MDVKSIILPRDVRDQFDPPNNDELHLEDLTIAFMVGRLRGRAVMSHFITGVILHQASCQDRLTTLSKWATSDSDALFPDSVWETHYANGFCESVRQVLRLMGEGNLAEAVCYTIEDDEEMLDVIE